jgi:glutathione S-transferase
MSDANKPLLWHFPISHYNEKVRWALDYKAIPHVREALGPSYMPRALWATRQGSLPILFLEGKAIADSTRIIEALESYAPDPPLYPADVAEVRRALALEDFFDEKVGHALRAVLLGPVFVDDPAAAVRILSTGMGDGAARTMRTILPVFSAFYRWRHKINDATVRAGHDQVRRAFDKVGTDLRSSGYLVGQGFTVADLTAAALLSPLVRPPELEYQTPGPVPDSILRLREEMSTHTAFLWVCEMYRRHRGRSSEVAS